MAATCRFSQGRARNDPWNDCQESNRGPFASRQILQNPFESIGRARTSVAGLALGLSVVDSAPLAAETLSIERLNHRNSRKRGGCMGGFTTGRMWARPMSS
jgi:hypothetical protein